MIKFLIKITMLLIFFNAGLQYNQAFKVKIEKPKKSGKWIEEDLLQFIENGKNLSFGDDQKNEKSKVIMVLGLTGTGKTTLVNYLNNIPLVCILKGGKWILDLENENITLPGGFSIGHTANSETLYPAVYAPPDKDFAYIDNPGFRDTRAIGVEIANSFFREQVTKNVTELKFLLLILHADLDVRGQQFRDTIKSFSSFLGIFDDKNAKLISKSIGIVITRVNNYGEDIKEYFKEKMLEVLDSEKENGLLSINEEKVFKNIIYDNQFEIFSNPGKATIIDNKESNKILKMINNLRYINKNDAKIRVRIDNSYIPPLLVYLNENYTKFKQDFEIKLENLTNDYFEKELYNKSSITIDDVAALNKNLDDFINKGTQKSNFETFINAINENIMNNRAKEEIKFTKNVFNFLIELLPKNNQIEFINEKQWISLDLSFKLNKLKTKVSIFIKKEFKKFESYVDELIGEYILNFYKFSTDKMTYMIDRDEIEKKLDEFQIQGAKINSLDIFIETMDEMIINKTHKDALKTKILEYKKPLDLLINMLPEDSQNEFSNEKSWIGLDLIIKLNELKSELKKYLYETYDYNYETGVFTFKGSLSGMRNVLDNIIYNNNIKNLTSVRIYATHSFIFDVNYEINKKKYETHAPDLVIISPILTFANPIEINLSCQHKPDYPAMNQKKANNGIKRGENGINGLPGLPGYNGGNLIVFAKKIFNENNLNFISSGGVGGPGQNGGDGMEGNKGDNAKFSDVVDNETNKRKTVINWNNQITFESITYYQALGKIGEDGGYSGRGGCGGYGGFDGTKVFINLNNKTNFELGVFYGERGINGEPGKSGIGGYYGDTAIKGKYFYSSSLSLRVSYPRKTEKILINEFRDKYDYLEPNRKRGKNGLVDFNLNYENQQEPIKSKINIINLENDYVQFINNYNYGFKYNLNKVFF